MSYRATIRPAWAVLAVLLLLAVAACGNDGRTGKMIEWQAGTPPAVVPPASPAPTVVG